MGVKPLICQLYFFLLAQKEVTNDDIQLIHVKVVVSKINDGQSQIRLWFIECVGEKTAVKVDFIEKIGSKQIY